MARTRSEMDLLGLQKRSQQQMRSCHGGGIGHLGAGWASERAIVVASEYTNKRAGVTEIIHMILRYLKKFYNHLEISRICAKIQCNIMYNNNWYQEIQTAHQKGLRRDKCSAEKSTFLHLLTMWGPPVMERRFINPMNTIVIGTINHSCWNYKPTISYSHAALCGRPQKKNMALWSVQCWASEQFTIFLKAARIQFWEFSNNPKVVWQWQIL